MFIGVRAKSGELIIADEASHEVKKVRTVRRVPEEERWDAGNLEWVKAVPWNMGKGDTEADGEAPEFDVKHGPGRRLTPGEVEDVAAKEDLKIVHRAHLK